MSYHIFFLNYPHKLDVKNENNHNKPLKSSQFHKILSVYKNQINSIQFLY